MLFRSKLSLIGTKQSYYEFNVDSFDDSSNLDTCKPGAGELLRMLPDGRLSYKASYSNAEAVLEKE